MHLVEHFSCYTILPIKLEDIKAHILETDSVESIAVLFPDMDPEIVRGFLRVHKPKGSNGPKSAEIFCSSRLSWPESRLVITKEMVHIFDEASEEAQSIEDVKTLISGITVPNLLAASIPLLSDRFAILVALCVLLPRDALVILRAHYRAGRMNVEAIARLVQLPEEYVDFALSDAWETVVEHIK